MINIKPQNIINSIIYPLLVCLFLSIVSCGIRKTTTEEQKPLEINPKIIFLNYSISKEENGNKKMVFINKTIANGRLKNSSNKYLKTGKKGDFICTQKDKNSNKLQTVYIKNPFSKTIEFINDSLIFESKKIDLTTTQISLRLQLNSKTKSIIISEIIDDLKNTNPLIETKLD